MRSSIIEDRAQIDGRRTVTEEHIADSGRVFYVSYLAEAGDNVRARMTARAPQIEAQLQREADDLAEGLLRDRAYTRLVAYVQGAIDSEIKLRLMINDAELAALRRGLTSFG